MGVSTVTTKIVTYPNGYTARMKEG